MMIPIGNKLIVEIINSNEDDWNPLYKLNFCSVVQKYKLAKTAAICKTLTNDAVFQTN